MTNATPNTARVGRDDSRMIALTATVDMIADMAPDELAALRAGLEADEALGAAMPAQDVMALAVIRYATFRI
jgi:hypothetical protein